MIDNPNGTADLADGGDAALEAALRSSAAALPDAPSPELDERIAERAAGEELLDVAYATVDSPLGRLVVAATPRGLVRVAYTESATDAGVLEELARKVSPRILEAPARLDAARRELDEYFEGRRTQFELPLDWELTRGFTSRVLQATARIAFGSTSTYAEVATQAGSPRAVRAAGNALGANPLPVVVPCHRVLRTGGGIGGYTGGLERKEYLLRLEGVLV
ncbi:MAG TPA: methylated-DNA--[protein]-cysteine S-methyltransferase [Thermoleophilaceae bacterium]|nr:methylated-DNA--[protein]-cysteine S-methyltransferase [Thermoleophilaceae bacterium]